WGADNLVRADHAQLTRVLHTYGEGIRLCIRGHNLQAAVSLERRPRPAHLITASPAPDPELGTGGACQSQQGNTGQTEESGRRGPECDISRHVGESPVAGPPTKAAAMTENINRLLQLLNK